MVVEKLLASIKGLAKLLLNSFRVLVRQAQAPASSIRQYLPEQLGTETAFDKASSFQRQHKSV